MKIGVVKFRVLAMLAAKSNESEEVRFGAAIARSLKRQGDTSVNAKYVYKVLKAFLREGWATSNSRYQGDLEKKCITLTELGKQMFLKISRDMEEVVMHLQKAIDEGRRGLVENEDDR